MSSHPRVQYRNVPGAADILTTDVLDFLTSLDDTMHAQLAAIRTARAVRLRHALQDNTSSPLLAPSEATVEPVAGAGERGGKP
jgi:hypothetical protein